jgi:predicted small secreted protein
MRRSALIAVLLLPVVVVTSGCSTLQHFGHPTIEAGRPDRTKEVPPDDFSLGAVLLWADGVRTDLEKHADGESGIPRWLGVALIPLAAAIAGLGITGTTGAPIVALALSGGTAVGVGGWLYSSQRV